MGSCACDTAEAETSGHVCAPAVSMCVETVLLSPHPTLMHIPQVVSSEKTTLTSQTSLKTALLLAKLLAPKQPDESQNLWISSPKMRQLLG